MTIKDIRERLGKTQQEMAELLGISRNYLALIEVGKRPESTELLEKSLLIVNKADAKLSAEEWKSRALSAEAKLAEIKKAMAKLINSM